MEEKRTINSLKKELKDLHFKYDELKKRYVLQNNELTKLKAFLVEVLNENKHWISKARTSRH